MRPSIGPFTRVVNAISITGCDAASEESGKLKCHKFTAEIEDWEDDPVDTSISFRVKTGQVKDVWHEFPEAMVAGERIKIAQDSDGRWVIVVWPCW